MRLFLVLFCMVFSSSSVYAERAHFQFLKTVTISELNAMLNAERAEFLEDAAQGDGYVLPPVSTATNDVDVYTVRYFSKSPELGGKKMLASGLLAVPSGSVNRNLPLMAYLHGTVFGKYEVPSYAFRQENPSGYSHYDQSYETRYMVALYAGNGYAVMAPDYFGLGAGAHLNEAYMMKRSTAQGNLDLYLDVKAFLATKGITPSQFFVGGWSQGGLNTTGFVQLLEQQGIDVRAAFTAAGPNDFFAAINAGLFHPRAIDAPYISAIIGLTAFSCERYIGPKGLAKKILDPKYYKDMKEIYERNAGAPQATIALIGKWASQQIPFTDFLRAEFRTPAAFASSDYGKCLAGTETYRQEFKTPLHMFYGSVDEVLRPMIALLGDDYQKRITDTPDAPSSSKVKTFEVKGADHRRTFISAAAAAKPWMDDMR